MELERESAICLLVWLRGKTSSRNQAATAARAFARPIGALSVANGVRQKLVPPAGLEPASPKATDFKSAVFTNFTKGARFGVCR